MTKVKLLTEAEIVACGSEILRAVHVDDDRRAEAMRALALARWARKAYARLTKHGNHWLNCDVRLLRECSCGLDALLAEIEEPTP